MLDEFGAMTSVTAHMSMKDKISEGELLHACCGIVFELYRVIAMSITKSTILNLNHHHHLSLLTG